jgi:hypothetical protein
MRRSCALGAVLAVLVLGGCDLGKDDSCTTEPGLANGGETVCVKPPPAQFSKMGP